MQRNEEEDKEVHIRIQGGDVGRALDTVDFHYTREGLGNSGEGVREIVHFFLYLVGNVILDNVSEAEADNGISENIIIC